MSEEGRTKLRRWAIRTGILAAILILGNWFMTYRLQRLLRKHMSEWVYKATDHFYDFNFQSVKIGFFYGDLTIKGISLNPDPTTLQQLEERHALPKEYYEIDINEIKFSGINLAWILDYKKLHFGELFMKNPNISIISTDDEDSAASKVKSPIRHKNSSKNKHDEASDENDDDEVGNFQLHNSNSLYAYISPYFDFIRINEIRLENANTDYKVLGENEKNYRLNNFDFIAKNFNLDSESASDHRPLFSEYFVLKTKAMQSIYESEIFLLNVDDLLVDTKDSLIVVSNIHFQTKEDYWNNRKILAGDKVDVIIGDLEINDVSFTRKNSGNYVSAKKLYVNSPDIEFTQVIEKLDWQKDETKDNLNIETNNENTNNWSLYGMVSPVFSSLQIDTIQLEKAKLEYNQELLDLGITDVYEFGNLNVISENFHINKKNPVFSVMDYFEAIRLNVDSLRGYVPTKNNELTVGYLTLDTKKKNIRIDDIDLRSIEKIQDQNYVDGVIKSINVTGLKYYEGIVADTLLIDEPFVNFNLNKKTKKQARKEKDNSEKIQELLANVTPYVKYLNIKAINLTNGELRLKDNLNQSEYSLKKLNFNANNFNVVADEDVLDNYFMKWDDYVLSFKDFDNQTPDKKYNIKISQGIFNSKKGNMLLKNLEISPIQADSNSYLKIKVPYAQLLGFSQKDLLHKKLLFESFIIDEPIIEIRNAKTKSHATLSESDEVSSSPSMENKDQLIVDALNFNILEITKPIIKYADGDNDKINLDIQKIYANNFGWRLGDSLTIDKMIIDQPVVDLKSISDNENKIKNKEKDRHKKTIKIDNIKIGELDIMKPSFNVDASLMNFNLVADKYAMKNLDIDVKDKSSFYLDTLFFINPNISLVKRELESKEDEVSKPDKTKEEKRGKIKKHINLKNIASQFPSFTNETVISFLDLEKLNLSYKIIKENGESETHNIKNTYLYLDNVKSNKEKESLKMRDLTFKTGDYKIDLDNGFYTIGFYDAYINKAKGIFQMDSISLIANVPKYEFAYITPDHQDWFNINVGQVKLQGIDVDKYFEEKKLYVDNALVDDVLLQNFKNGKIYTPPKLVPLLYEIFDNVPIDYYIDTLNLKRFTAVYEELYKNGYIPGQITFSDMNGEVQGFTNIPQTDRNFYILNADGLAFGEAPFKAIWTMPIETKTDRFYAWAKIEPFDLTVLNKLISPTAPAYIERGVMKNYEFYTSSSTVDAYVKLDMEYEDLYVVLTDGLRSNNKKKLESSLLNRLVIKDNNIDGKKFRLTIDSVTRNPYHSNFNYFVQLLMPTSIQSLGISKEKQKNVKKIETFFRKLTRIIPYRKEGEDTINASNHDEK